MRQRQKILEMLDSDERVVKHYIEEDSLNHEVANNDSDECKDGLPGCAAQGKEE